MTKIKPDDRRLQGIDVIKIFDALEPKAQEACFPEHMTDVPKSIVLLSAAISLKRIADALEQEHER